MKFWRLQESCKWEKELFGACNNLASEKKTFWRLQDCCKHFQNQNRYIFNHLKDYDYARRLYTVGRHTD